MAARRHVVVRALTFLIMTLATSVVAPSGVAAASHPLVPPHHPARNFRLISLTDVLASIDAARSAEEGLAPLAFDTGRFARLDVAEQIFVLTNLERTSRGRAPVIALTRRLDAVAQVAASRDEDPTDDAHSYWSIWSSAPASLGQAAYFADFGWMYADGPPPQYIFRNVDCTRVAEAGCWGHRDNILVRPARATGACPPELLAGTGFARRSPDGPSLTEILETACHGAKLTTVFTWRHAMAYLKIPVVESGTGRSLAR